MVTISDTYLAATEEHRLACDYYSAYVASEGEDATALRLIRGSVPPGIYEHWKSKEDDPKFYCVLAVGCERDVYTPLVTYASLYGEHAGELSFLHLLNEDNGFLKPINRPAYRGRRFTLIRKLQLSQLSMLIERSGELSQIKRTVEFRIRAGRLLHDKKLLMS